MASHSIVLLGAWAVAGLLLAWPRLSGPGRRRLALLSSGAGVVSLILAMSAEGFRESPTMGTFLMGTSYVVAKTSASAGLPYYVLTGAFLLLGFAGLALGDGAASRLRRHPLSVAIGLSLLITALRFMLEKTAAPSLWTQGVGITGIAPVVGAYLALHFRAAGKGLRALLGALVAYAFAVRGAVAALMVVTTRWRLGSHYDVSSLTLVANPLNGEVYSFQPGSLQQILKVGILPQLLVWPVYTVVAGLLGAALALVVASAWSPPTKGLPAPAPDPLPQD